MSNEGKGVATPASTSSPNHRVPEAADYELKKKYLGLLPPEQIIEICLKLDMFAVSYIRSTVWPMDLNKAIENLLQAAPSSPTPNKPGIQQPSVTASEHGPNQQSELLQENAQAGPGPTTQQNYQRHLSASQPGHPHTPYFAGGPFLAYQANNAVSHPPQFSQPQYLATADDLPSYEEMIAQALASMPIPEGIAPKDLFTWMAAHYPVQANFRPSASQALQKAYKRGRFEKTPVGKYRLTPGWDGPINTKRTTRRPQPIPHPSFPRPPQHTANAFGGALKTTIQGTPGSATTEDAFKAAQNILNALPMGALFSLPEDKTKPPLTKPAPRPPTGATILQLEPLPPPRSVPPERIELQTRLALLASQLLEYASSEPLTTGPVLPEPGPTSRSNVSATTASLSLDERFSEEEEDDGDMEQVVI